MKGVGIFFIVEPGRLEQQALILVISLRKMGGISKQRVLHAIQPRNSGTIKPSTKTFFAANNVHFEKINLNQKFFFYPLANKIFAGAYFEKKYAYSSHLFLDTDLLIGDNIQSLFNTGKKIFISPVHQKGMGIGTNETHSLWEILFDYIHIENRWVVQSLVDKQTIIHYFNTGVISYDSSREIFHLSKTYFEQIMKDRRVLSLPFNYFYFLEQAIVSCTIAQLFKKEEIELLPVSYNFPVELTQEGVELATIIHLQNFLEKNDTAIFPHEIKSVVNETKWSSKKKNWLLRFREIISFQLFKLSFIAK